MVKIKICGVTNLGDAFLTHKYGADFMGMILVPKTSRSITKKQAKKIVSIAPKSITSVAVTIPKNIEEINEIEKVVNPDIIQVHSDIDLSYLEHECKIIQTVHVSSDAVEIAKKIEPYIDFILLDTKTRLPGGAGILNDLNKCSEVVKAVDKPVILAGGLRIRNVVEAIELVKPFAVDVSSGVELYPGKKDPQKIKDFIRKVRAWTN